MNKVFDRQALLMEVLAMKHDSYLRAQLREQQVKDANKAFVHYLLTIKTDSRLLDAICFLTHLTPEVVLRKVDELISQSGEA